MRKATFVILLLLGFSVLMIFIGCGSDEYEKQGRYKVILEENAAFVISGDSFCTVGAGENVTFDVNLLEGFEMQSVIGGYYDYDEKKIICKNVHSHITVKITAALIDSPYSIMFDLGDGVSAYNQSQRFVYKKYDPTVRLRVNTLIDADVSPREGYSLVGWNTTSDGKGKHIGLGSRVTLSDYKGILLFAEWKEWRVASDFNVSASDGKCKIIGYTGEEQEEIVVPGAINGNVVTEIAKGAFSGCYAKSIYLPKSLICIDDGAFINCALMRLYAYDNIENIYENSFINCKNFTTFSVNAAQQPRYTKYWTACWADKFDRLILAEPEEKQMVFFAGSSMAHGLDSEAVGRSFKSEYKTTNLGVSYLINTSMQLEIINALLRENDILIHAPEDLSQRQSLSEFNNLTWRVLEFNYDLLTYVDISRHLSVFDALASFNKERADLPASSYNEKSADYNKYGDLSTLRLNTDNTDKGYDTVFDSIALKEDILVELKGRFSAIKGKGVKVYFSYGPANLDGAKMPSFATRLAYTNKISQFITNVPIISYMENYMYRGKYFYNTNYHLTTEGASIRTQQLINDIKMQMNRE